MADAIETDPNATIVGRRDLETVLAGDNRTSSDIAVNLVDVRDSPAVLPVGDVISKGTSDSATTT